MQPSRQFQIGREFRWGPGQPDKDLLGDILSHPQVSHPALGHAIHQAGVLPD